MPNRLLFSQYAKIVKGESRIKYRNLFQIFFIPSRILSYSKIVKGDRIEKPKTQFSSLSMPSLSGPRVAARGDAQSYRTSMRYPGNTVPVIPHLMRNPENAWAGELAKYIPFYVPLLDPALQHGVTHGSYRTSMRYPGNTVPVIPHLMRNPENAWAGELAKYIPFYVPLLDPALQHGVTHGSYRTSMRYPGNTVPVIPHLMRNPENAWAGELAKYIPFYVPLLDPASQRGVTCGHTAPRCGIWHI